MKSRYGMIEEKRSEANKSVGSISVEVNTIAAQIARLNNEIACEYPKGSDNNSRNQRQALVDKLAELVGIQCYEDSQGRLTITVENGIPLVSGSRAYSMVTSDVNADGNYTVQIEIGNPIETSPGVWEHGERIDVTADIKNGKMGGMLDLRDNILPGYLRNLDQLAAGVVQQVNALHATGYGLGTGGVQMDFFLGVYGNAANGLPLDNTSTPIDFTDYYRDMVRYLEVNPAIVGNPRYVASSSAPGESGNNEIARRIAELQTASDTVIVDNAGLITKGPFSTFLTNVANAVGNQALKYHQGGAGDPKGPPVRR